MAVQLKANWKDALSDDVIDLLLDEADRALLDVEARTDEPGRRYSLSDLESQELEDLRLAMAELSDAHPGMQYELESIGDRLRNVGAIATLALGARRGGSGVPDLGFRPASRPAPAAVVAALRRVTGGVGS